MTSTALAAMAAAFAVPFAGAQSEPSFRRLPRGFIALSADGTIGLTTRHERWTAATGYQPYLLPGGLIGGSAHAMSWDGMTTAGHCTIGSPEQLGYRWSPTASAVLRDAPDGRQNVACNGMSGNGTVIVGTMHGVEDLGQASYWSSGDRPIAFGPARSSGTTCSSDERVIWGCIPYERAFRWTATDGLLDIPSSVVPVACSASGDIMVGDELTNGNAVIWTRGTGVQRIQLPANWTIGSAQSISADGRLVVGNARVSGLPQREAWIWDHHHGARPLREVATAQLGFDVGDLPLALSMSADGRSISGNGYLLRLAAPCAGDVDDGSGTGGRDDAVNADDLTAFLVWFSNNDMRADLDDGSGSGHPDAAVTIEDLLYFIVGYIGGCC